jgi:hypothetical protein
VVESERREFVNGLFQDGGRKRVCVAMACQVCEWMLSRANAVLIKAGIDEKRAHMLLGL